MNAYYLLAYIINIIPLIPLFISYSNSTITKYKSSISNYIYIIK